MMRRCTVRGCQTLLPTVVRYVPLYDGDHYLETRPVDPNAQRAHLVSEHRPTTRLFWEMAR